MELNWSTFLLEIINFLVLVWLLKRFLYKPVLDIIARRRQAIEDQLAEAKQLHADADQLKQQYEHRLSDWEQERQKALRSLTHELEENRRQKLHKLQTELAQEEEKIRVAESRQQQQLAREIEQRALKQGAEFASRLLTQAAGPELQQRLFDVLLKDLQDMSAEQKTALTNEWGETPTQILVASAYPLGDEHKHRLEQTLLAITDLSVPLVYEQDANLLAGLRISVGAWVIQLNVANELQGFAEFGHVEQ